MRCLKPNFLFFFAAASAGIFGSLSYRLKSLGTVFFSSNSNSNNSNNNNSNNTGNSNNSDNSNNGNNKNNKSVYCPKKISSIYSSLLIGVRSDFSTFLIAWY